MKVILSKIVASLTDMLNEASGNRLMMNIVVVSIAVVPIESVTCNVTVRNPLVVYT